MMRLSIIIASFTSVVGANNEGMAIFGNGSSDPPGYAHWDGDGFSSQGSMRDSTDGRWRIIQGAYAPTRDEAIVIGVSADEVVTAQMYSEGRWNDLPFSPLDDKAENSWSFGFDVRYESQSGNALVVWHEGSRDTILYSTWDGAKWSPPQRIDTPVRGGEHSEVNLEASPVTNEMVLIAGVISESDYCIVWDGTSWSNGIDLENKGTGNLRNIGVAYEQNRGRAMVIYGDGQASLPYQIWDGHKWRKGYASAPSDIHKRVLHVTIGADPSSNRIAVGVTSDSDHAFWVGVWDGNNGFGSVQRVASGSSAEDYHGIAVAFEGISGHAIATYAQNSDAVRYRTWSSTSGWSDENDGPDLGAEPNSMMLYSAHGSNEIMLAVQNNNQEASFCSWSAGGWGKLSKMSLDTGERHNKNQPYLFMWKPIAGTIDPTPLPTSQPTPPPTPFPSPPPTPPPTQMGPTPSPTYSPTEKPTVCVDDPEGWYDPDGEIYNCPWYGLDDNCNQYGDLFENFGVTANEACCACDGGKLLSIDEITLSPTPQPTDRPTITPTKDPTNGPTDYPTPFPTSSPSLKPTLMPTELPTEPPTLEPWTPQPTPKPTGPPTPPPSTNPTRLPTPSPTGRPTRPPTQDPTVRPTATVTSSPTDMPTRSFTAEPTRKPTGSPTRGPASVLISDYRLPPTDLSNETDPINSLSKSMGTGKPCSTNQQCKSSTCRNGVCMASSACYPIKHKFAKAFDEHSVNIVFVASAFNSVGHKEWKSKANSTYEFMQIYNMFAKEIDELNIFLVDPPSLDRSFCQLGCAGIDRLLCCDTTRAHALASKCFPVGSNLQTLVVHNSGQYGGAGYPSANIATVSTHPAAPLVLVHELGHSLFELADEYSYGGGTDIEPNCAASEACSKWSDLMGPENTPEGYDPVQCIPGCRNNNYFVGAQTFMNVLSYPVGSVNERFTCCTYLALTKQFPSYCQVFDTSPDYLLNYCKNNDYQNYGKSNYEMEGILAIPGYVNKDSKDAKYAHVSEPVLVTITQKVKRSGRVVFRTKKPTPLKSGMFPRSQINGDFPNPRAAAKKGVNSLLKVMVVYRGTRQKDTLFFSQNTTIQIPLPEPGDTESQDEPPMVSEKSDAVELVLDTKGRDIESIRVKPVETKRTAVQGR